MVTFDRAQLLLPSSKRPIIIRMKKRAQLLLPSAKKTIIMKHNKSHSLLIPIFKETCKHTRKTSKFSETISGGICFFKSTQNTIGNYHNNKLLQ